MLSSPDDAPKIKRTRTNVKQSKYGCFTCKARRIKCDESKPTCRRCLTSKRPCGYPHGAPSTTPFSLTLNANLPQNRFVNLMCRVLVQGPRRAKNDLELSFWSHTIPQLANSIPSVQAAAAAFGASYDAHVLGGSQSPETIECYTRALRLVQLDLSSLEYGAIPCIVACLFLSFAEALQQRMDKGLLHLQGAFALLRSNTTPTSNMIIDKEQVSLLFRKLDLHPPTFSVGRPPDLPPLPVSTPGALLSCPPDESLFRILHSCYHFTAAASHYKYVSRRILPPDLLIEQGRHLADLKQWLSRDKAAAQVEQLLVLRAQCLAAFVHAATALEPHEAAFDHYGPEFQEIITSVETISRYAVDGDSCTTSQDDLPFFTPEMGIIHPLFFTALKYRHPIWRRRAIALLKKSGREGPWVGEIEAALASAVAEREEQQTKECSDPRDISEVDRINTCWVVEFMRDEQDGGTYNSRTEVTKIKAILVRCFDVDEMLRGSVDGPNKHPWRDKRHWAGWEETIPVPYKAELGLCASS